MWCVDFFGFDLKHRIFGVSPYRSHKARIADFVAIPVDFRWNDILEPMGGV